MSSIIPWKSQSWLDPDHLQKLRIVYLQSLCIIYPWGPMVFGKKKISDMRIPKGKICYNACTLIYAKLLRWHKFLFMIVKQHVSFSPIYWIQISHGLSLKLFVCTAWLQSDQEADRRSDYPWLSGERQGLSEHVQVPGLIQPIDHVWRHTPNCI